MKHIIEDCKKTLEDAGYKLECNENSCKFDTEKSCSGTALKNG